MQFPADSALGARYPNGFSDLANAIYPTVERSAELSAAYGRDGLSTPALAVTEVIGYSLGITIDDYVFMDLGGFSDLIDAIGGVTMQLDRAYDIPPNVADPTRPVPARIGPGEVWMDGPLAMGYARTRYADSDVGRMGRQRELFAAITEQVSAYEALVKMPEILESLSGSLSTSLDRERLMRLVGLIGGDVEVAESVALARPVVNTARPDYDEVRWMGSDLREGLIGLETRPDDVCWVCQMSMVIAIRGDPFGGPVAIERTFAGLPELVNNDDTTSVDSCRDNALERDRNEP